MAGREDDIMAIVDDFDKRDGSDYGDGPNDPADDTSDNEPLDDNEEIGDDEADDADSDIDSAPSASQSADRVDGDAGPSKPVDKTKETPSKLQMLNNGLAQDEKGNLVDPNSGQIIARAGSERRLFEKTTRMQTAMKERDNEILALKKQIADTQFLNGVPDKYGVNRDEVTQALELAVAFKRDPASAARKVLELALASGYNISQILGEGASDSVEMGAVKRMLDERLAPLTTLQQQQQTTQREREIQQRAESDLNAWLDQREHASIHLEAIDRIMGNNPGLSPDAAYYELREFAIKNGLDFSAPLAPQVAALRQRGKTPNQNRQAPRASNPLPNGRRPAGVRPISETEQADPNMSWEDLVRSSMRTM